MARPRRRVLLPILLLAVAGGTALGLLQLWHRTPEAVAPAVQVSEAAPLVTTARVEPRPMTRSLSVAGSLAALHDVPIGVETSGSRIDAVLVDAGDHVTKGQVLARLDASVLQAQLRHAQAAIQAAAAGAAVAAAAFKRVDGIRGTGAVSGEQVAQRQADAASAEAHLAEAQAQASEIQARLDDLMVRAPVAGVIAERHAEPGTIAAPGGSPLFRLIEGGLVQFDAQVPEDQLQRLAPGMPVEISLGGPDDVTGDTTITGHIRAIAPTIDPQTRLGLVHIALPVDARLRPGAFVQGRIVLSRSQALSVPLSAVLWQGGSRFVYAVTKGHAQRRPVQIAATQDGWVEVRQGLDAGESVVLTAGAFMHDGEAVRQAPAARTSPAVSTGLGVE
ncbi:MAG TPA: efflux RND transporter periplasmic adaptor subunit [Rhodopila sp.]|nr:efflux RND transporter periplasmic adaptor subunit [Rhodopila sp.]